jgi:hypothetical protein
MTSNVPGLRESKRSARRIEFGGHERYREEGYEALGGNFIESLVQDLRFALRLLRKSPGFALVCVLTLALGIGANAVVFSVINAFIIHPLHVREADTLYQIERGKDKAGNHSYPDYLDLRDRNRSFDGLAAFDICLAGLNVDKDPSRSWGVIATGSFTHSALSWPVLPRVRRARHKQRAVCRAEFSLCHCSGSGYMDSGAVRPCHSIL